MRAKEREAVEAYIEAAVRVIELSGTGMIVDHPCGKALILPTHDPDQRHEAAQRLNKADDALREFLRL